MRRSVYAAAVLLALIPREASAAGRSRLSARERESEAIRNRQLGGLVRRYQRFLDKLPRCTRAEKARAEDLVLDTVTELRQRQARVTLRGRLKNEPPMCTLMLCSPGPCCNGCSFHWVLAPDARPGRGLRVHRLGDKRPLRDSCPDCLRNLIPSVDVVVSGRITAADLIEDARVCRTARVTPSAFRPNRDNDGESRRNVSRRTPSRNSVTATRLIRG
jgi:hypothetical protein